jgi:hypothetical protein
VKLSFITVQLGLHVVGVPFLLQGGDERILLLDFRFQSTDFCLQTDDFGFQNFFDFNLIEFIIINSTETGKLISFSHVIFRQLFDGFFERNSRCCCTSQKQPTQADDGVEVTCHILRVWFFTFSKTKTKMIILSG